MENFLLRILRQPFGVGGGTFLLFKLERWTALHTIPFHKSVVELGWHGLLVEPIPYLNKKLRENYKNCDGLVFAQTAIADFEGSIEMTYLNPATVPEGVFASGAFGTSTLMPDRGVMANGTFSGYS